MDAAIADATAAVVRWAQARSIIGVAGTVTTVAALALDLPTYDAAKIHQARIPAERVRDVAGRNCWPRPGSNARDDRGRCIRAGSTRSQRARWSSTAS